MKVSKTNEVLCILKLLASVFSFLSLVPLSAESNLQGYYIAISVFILSKLSDVYSSLIQVKNKNILGFLLYIIAIPVIVCSIATSVTLTWSYGILLESKAELLSNAFMVLLVVSLILSSVDFYAFFALACDDYLLDRQQKKILEAAEK